MEEGKELGQAGISFTQRSQTWSAVCLSVYLPRSIFTSITVCSLCKVVSERERERERNGESQTEREMKDKQRRGAAIKTDI